MKSIAAVTIVLLFLITWLAFRYTPSPEPSNSSTRPEATIEPKQTVLAIENQSEDTVSSDAAIDQVVESEGNLKPEQEASSSPDYITDEILSAENVINDSEYGVSLTFPQDWTVKNAIRWGSNKSTIFFNPPEGSEAIPSVFYQKFSEAPPDRAYAEAVMRDQARKKEAARLKDGIVDYKNDPESFRYREINGNPTLSYFSTYMNGDEVEAEYFTRILGEEGYVMFFVRGPADDVSALITPVTDMSETVTPP